MGKSNHYERSLLRPTPLQQLQAAALAEDFAGCRHTVNCYCNTYRAVAHRVAQGKLSLDSQLRLLDRLWEARRKEGG